MCDWFPIYDRIADRRKKYIIKCYDYDNKLICYRVTTDYDEVKKTIKVVKNCKVVEL